METDFPEHCGSEQRGLNGPIGMRGSVESGGLGSGVLEAIVRTCIGCSVASLCESKLFFPLGRCRGSTVVLHMVKLTSESQNPMAACHWHLECWEPGVIRGYDKFPSLHSISCLMLSILSSDSVSV